jgi:glycine cleavage system H protein
MADSELRFARTHEWVKAEGKTARVGISDFAVKELTDLVFIDLPKVGKSVVAGESFGEVESVKAVSDLYAPVSGTIVAVNTDLPGNLQWLSEDAFGKGWIAQIELDTPEEVSRLMSSAEYEVFCQSNLH